MDSFDARNGPSASLDFILFVFTEDRDHWTSQYLEAPERQARRNVDSNLASDGGLTVAALSPKRSDSSSRQEVFHDPVAGWRLFARAPSGRSFDRQWFVVSELEVGVGFVFLVHRALNMQNDELSLAV